MAGRNEVRFILHVGHIIFEGGGGVLEMTLTW